MPENAQFVRQAALHWKGCGRIQAESVGIYPTCGLILKRVAGKFVGRVWVGERDSSTAEKATSTLSMAVMEGAARYAAALSRRAASRIRPAAARIAAI